MRSDSFINIFISTTAGYLKHHNFSVRSLNIVPNKSTGILLLLLNSYKL